MSAKGGITDGKSHKEGGIPMVVKSTGQKVELEGGEGVINKRNMASEKTFEFEGEQKTICEIASEINSADGNGVEINCDNITGKQYKYNDGGQIFMTDNEKEWWDDSFNDWLEDGNVTTNQDGTYSTQDAQYTNKLKNLEELKEYFYNEFIKGQYDEYAEGGKILASSSSIEGINKLISQYLFGSTIQLVPMSENNNFYEVHNKKGKTPFYVDYSRGKYRFIQPTQFEKGGKLKNTLPIEEYKSAEISLDNYEDGGIEMGAVTEFEDGGEIKKGAKMEMEHKSTIDKIKRSDISTKEVSTLIAKDHLREDKDYYKKLELIENTNLINDALLCYDFAKRKRKQKRKYAMGGGIFNQNHHKVHLVFSKTIRLPLYTFNGKYDGDVVLKENIITPMLFIEKEEKETKLGFIGTEKYVIVPNSLITIKGFDIQYAEGGNVPKQYNGYENRLSETDLQVLKMLREYNNSNNFTISEKILLSSFKGTNVVNQLSIEIIDKLYSLLFQFHTIEYPIKNLLIKNAGVGNILNQAPTYLDNIVVQFDDKDEFQNIENEICQIINFSTYDKKWNNYSLEYYTNVDAMIYCYPTIDTENDEINNEMFNHKRMRIAIAIAEFSSKQKAESFVQTLENGTDNIEKIMFISQGITNKGKYSIIYIVKKK